MKAFFEKYKQYIYIAIGLVAAWFIYSQFLSGGTLGALLSPQSGSISQEKADQILSEQTQLASELSFLDTIRFDPSFFNGALFGSLTDFSQPLPEEIVGRPNPFAPVDSKAAATTSGTTTGAR